jgi:hypothetical protein
VPIGQLDPPDFRGALARFLPPVVVRDDVVDARFELVRLFDPEAFDADAFAAGFLAVEVLVAAVVEVDFDVVRVRRFGLLSPIGSASPTAFIAPVARSPTVPATLPA